MLTRKHAPRPSRPDRSEEFASYRAPKPADRFARLTGWAGRTNEHARDAAMLVYGRKS